MNPFVPLLASGALYATDALRRASQNADLDTQLEKVLGYFPTKKILSNSRLRSLYDNKRKLEIPTPVLGNKNQNQFRISPPSEYEILNQLADFKNTLKEERKENKGINKLKFAYDDPDQYKYLTGSDPLITSLKLLRAEEDPDFSREKLNRYLEIIQAQQNNLSNP